MTIAGGAIGVVFAAGGAGVNALWHEARTPLAIVLGAVTLAYAFHELELVRLPVPGRDWQVPAHWVRNSFYRSAALFGGTVGLGIVTRVPYASFPILLTWLFVAGNVWYGLAAGLLYGALRAISIYSSVNVEGPEQLVELNQRLMRFAPSFHQVTGLALAAFAAYLLLAPTLP